MNPTTASVECFDPTLDLWQDVPPMAHPRAWPAVAAPLGGRLYACGGFRDDRGGRENLSSVEAFCPQFSRWERAPSLSARRMRAAAAVVAGRLFVCGGEDDEQILSSVESLREGAQTW